MSALAGRLAVGLGTAGLCGAIGVASVSHRDGALALTVLSLVAIVLVLRPVLCWWDLFFAALAGSLVLGYGFANVRLPGAPVPVADGVAVVLVLRAWLSRSFRWPSTAPFVLAAAFLAIAAVRLSFDVPVWGKGALRDFTLPLEVVFLPIGYWVLRTYGIARLQRALAWTFVVCLVYFAFFSFSDRIAALGPTVGIQRPVPLLGSFAGAATSAAAGFFFFALIMPFGRISYLLAAGFLAELALFQGRGIYLAIPAAAALIWMLAGRSGARPRRGLAVTFAVGIFVLAALLPLAPQGRLGPVSPSFALSQIRTLQGRPGPGSGTYEDRVAWFHEVVGRVQAHGLSGFAVGVGLGPDLVGHVKGTGTLLRKPHDDYLEIFARLGIPALIIFVSMLLAAVVRVIAGARRATEENARFLWWIFATAVVFMIVAATQPLLAFPYGTIPLFGLLGAGLALAERPRES